MNKDLKKFFVNHNMKKPTTKEEIKCEFDTLSKLLGGIKHRGDFLSDDILELESYSYSYLIEELDYNTVDIVVSNEEEAPKLILELVANVPFNVKHITYGVELITFKYEEFTPQKSTFLESYLSNLGILSKRKLMTIFDKAIEVYDLDKDNLIIGIPYVDKNPMEKTFLEKTDYKTLSSLPDNYNIGVVCEYVDQKDIVSL